MVDHGKVINKVTAIVADMQEEVDEWKDYSDSELRGGLTCDCDWWYKTLQTLKDALALLKQEPVKPTVEHNPAGQPMWCCGNCGTTLFFKFHRQTDDEDERSHYKFCHYCGMEVKWDG